MARSKYQQPRSTRRESRTLAGRFRGGKLAPVMAVPFRESESGVLSQTITYELDPIAGRMITPITAEVVAVYVPVPAIDALKNPADDLPGNAEAIRQKLLAGNPLFGLEAETEVSKRMGVVPRSISGVKKVNEVARLAHNVAVNYLRLRKYVKATQLLASNTAMTPALISTTVLDRFNAVLDPEDRVNGQVDLGGKIPVEGIATSSQTFGTTPETVYETGKTSSSTYNNEVGGSGMRVTEDPDNPGFPGIFATLNAGISLSDFWAAQTTDRLTREMREMVDDNPQYGEEQVARFAAGLTVDMGKEPFVIYRKEVTFGARLERAMDGASLGTMNTNMVAAHDFTVMVPATEFGGVVVTFAVVKPDETVATQPHPIMSVEWGARNYVADELAIDPVPVTIRELDGECLQVDEGTTAFYVGNNYLEKHYVNYGFNRELDQTTVENKTALWQLQVPLSVTPDTVLYPETLDHYPFDNQLAEVCTYTINSNVRINTPRIFGPTPVEELAEIEDSDIFEDA